MNSGATSERVYEALKWRILEGELRPGARLDPSQLGSELSASTTPLREALHRLVGEGLVETGISEGFRVPIVTEPGLRDLYAWTNAILGWAVRAVTESSPAGYSGGRAATELRANLPYPLQASTLFQAIARRSPNTEHERAINAVNDRLHAARMVEAETDPLALRDLAAVSDAFGGSSSRGLTATLNVYHRRRQASAADTVRMMLRGR